MVCAYKLCHMNRKKIPYQVHYCFFQITAGKVHYLIKYNLWSSGFNNNSSFTTTVTISVLCGGPSDIFSVTVIWKSSTLRGINLWYKCWKEEYSEKTHR